ncbi:hypothetical protein SLE2022_350930 [Rubroshorea leprosula]
MNAGALFFSPNFHSLYQPKNPPDFSTRNKASPVRTQFRVGVHNRFRVFRVSVWNSGRRRSGKVYADVREMPESIRESGLIPCWEQFPKRSVIVILCFSAFLLCNMDRVDMSIAILPMSAEFNWTSTIVGLIQSSFLWGTFLLRLLLAYGRTRWEVSPGSWRSLVVCCYCSYSLLVTEKKRDNLMRGCHFAV